MRALAVSSVVFLSLIVAGPPPAQAAAGGIDEFYRNLERLLPALGEKYGVDGAAVGVVHKGMVIKCLGFGYADKSNRRAASDDTEFQVASVSKPLTA